MSSPVKYPSRFFTKAAFAVAALLSFADAQQVIYSQGFESDSGRYSHSGTYDKWEWGTPSTARKALGPSSAHNGLKCWGTDFDSVVPANSDMLLTSPAILLPTITTNEVLRVRFFAWIAVDYMNDRGEFQVSSDQSTWETKAQLLLKMQGGWNEYYFNVSKFAGGNIFLRFRCRTDGSVRAADTMGGLYVDDIAIFKAEAPATKTVLSLEGFENPSSTASCPWIFPWNGIDFVKDNDVYSTARGPEKRYTDYYKLGIPLVPSNGKYLLNLVETDDEESYTDRVRLITVDHPDGTRVAPDANGRIFTFADPSPPVAAADKNGSDKAEAVSAEDGIGVKLYNGDFVDFDFGDQAATDSAVFIMRARGFLSDGTDGASAVSLQPLLTIQTQDGTGEWIGRAIFYPRWESSVCAYDLRGALSFSKKIRVTATSCHTDKYHLVDYVGLSVGERREFTQTELSPVSAVHSSGVDLADKLAASDSNFAYMASGQKISLSFDAPDVRAGTVRDFIFVSDGFYVPMGTFFIYTWDGSAWAQRDGWSIVNSSSGVDSTRAFDLSLWLPDPDGDYKVRIWQDYFYNDAGIDYLGITRGGAAGNMTRAVDLRTSSNILSVLNSSDNVKQSWGSTKPFRDRWVEAEWNGLGTNTPPTTNPVTISNPTSPTPVIVWTYGDVDNNPQSQFEVEVWTGPNGTGANMWDPAVGNGTAASVTYAGAALVYGQSYYARVKAFDGSSWGGWSEVNWVYQNVSPPPVAEAGPNRIVAAYPACEASVMLDGRGSSGTIASYSWTGPFSGTLTGATPSVTLSLGVNRIFLTVSNSAGSSRDSVFITVTDTMAPVPDVATLPAIRAQCAVTLIPPTATDNCAAGAITGTTTDSLSYVTQGIRTVRWTYSDGSGNSSSQTQTVIVSDTIPPALIRGNDTAVIVAFGAKAMIGLKPATASDNCAQPVLQARRSDGLSPDSAYPVGVTDVTWRACDGKGNCTEAIQKVTVRMNRPPALSATPDTTIPEKTALSIVVSGSDPDGNALSISAASPLPGGSSLTDNGGGMALFSWNTGCSDHGDYAIAVKAFDGIDSAIDTIHVKVTDVDFPPVFLDSGGSQCAIVLKDFSYTVRTQDCDGTFPRIRAINLPPGASFTDNHDGTGSVLWNPKQNEAGYYMVIFEAKDDATTVRDTIIIVVDDASHFAPRITVSSLDTTVGINLPITLFARATAQDGTIPRLSATSLPSGAQFTCDIDGNGVFSWTPRSIGKDSLALAARHVSDSTLQTRCVVKITIDDRNVTGPVFLAHGDTAVDQNTELALTVEARDPDGTVPQLYSVSAPQGARFVDNGNGTGTFFWKPGCDVAGDFTLRAGATDRYLADSISVGVDVRVVNFPPVFAPLSDISAVPGEMVHILVSAADKCIGSITPSLSVSCALTGYTFESRGDGTGLFGWKAGSDTGSYPIVFWATGGFATTSDTVILSINKTGSLILSAHPKGARIHAMPSEAYAGKFLGSDSAVYRARPGTYWFEIQAQGYRSERIFCEIKPDSTARAQVDLKPAIPLMLTEAETFAADTVISAFAAGAFTFLDANGDGLLDLSVISGQDIKTCYQYKGAAHSGFRSLSLDTMRLAAPLASPVSHVFSDWNNSGDYSCIVSTATGKILLLKPVKGIFTVAETLCTVRGSKPYPIVVDADRDGRKDLVVHAEGVGIFLFPDTGSDSLPRLGACRELLSASGAASVTDCKGPPLLMDLDQTGFCKWVLASGGVLRTYVVDSALSKITYESDLNCAGARLATDSARYALMGPPLGQPRLAVVRGAALRLFSTHLLGDVNGDGTVDIRDMSRISKSWELTDGDSSWTPLHNLKLSGGGREVIDISDIGRASKCWELKE